MLGNPRKTNQCFKKIFNAMVNVTIACKMLFKITSDELKMLTHTSILMAMHTDSS